jgi:hypothetical protein
MSPDGKWIWDGSQWRPLPVHEAIFPHWKSVGAGVTAADVTPPAASRAGRAGASEGPAYRLAAPAPLIASPVWRQPSRSGTANKFMYVAGGAVACLLVVGIVFGSVTALSRSSQPTPLAPATSVPTTGPTTRSDSARAAYLVKSLEAPMADLKDNLALMGSACRVGLTSSCADSLIAIDNNLGALVPILEKATVPRCIAAQEGPLKSDIAQMSAGAQLAYKGYKDNKKTEFTTGASQIYAVSGRVQSEFTAMKSVAATCDSQITGP